MEGNGSCRSVEAVCPFPEYGHVEAHMDSTADIDALKRDAFLRYLNQQAGGDTSTVFKIGDVGDAMGLPYSSPGPACGQTSPAVVEVRSNLYPLRDHPC